MTKLVKGLGFWAILSLAIGSIMGTGMFFGTAIGAGYSGNMVLLAWIALSVIAIYVAACFGELSAMFPKSGGVYEFAKQAYGRFTSFLVAWVAWLVGNITSVILVVAAIEYLLPLKELWMLKIIISALFIIILNFIAFVGIEASAFTLIAFAFIMVGVVSAVILKGLFFVNISNLSPFLLHTNPLLNLSAIFVTLFFLAETFFGWESATYLAEETREPEKVIPKALIFGTIIVAILGIVLCFVMLGIMPWRNLVQASAPLSNISSMIFGSLGKSIVSIGVFLTLLGSAAGSIITMPRLVLALARDRLFLGHFKSIHPRFSTPHISIVFQAIVLLLFLLMGFGRYRVLLSLLVPLALIMYIAVLLALPILRIKRPLKERPFKAPFGRVAPLFVIAFFVIVMFVWIKAVPNAIDLLKLSISTVLFAFPLYFLVELYYDPKMITSINDVFSHVTLLTEGFSLPQDIRKRALMLLGDVRGKAVLEFGCGIGTITVPLLKAVGPSGLVYATHFSKNDLRIVKKRYELKEWLSEERELGRLKLVHDEEHFNRLNPDIKYADSVVSIGMLSYLQNPRRILEQIYRIMPVGGRICLVEYSDYFHIIPNVEWLSNEAKIERMFRDIGFSVRVMKKKGLLWNHMFIYGIKFSKDVAFI